MSSLSKPARLLHRFHLDLRAWSIAPCNGYCNSGSHELLDLCDVLVCEARAKDDSLDALFLDKGSADFQCLSLTFDQSYVCLLYTSDAADDLLCVDLGGRRIIKKKKKKKKKKNRQT